MYLSLDNKRNEEVGSGDVSTNAATASRPDHMRRENHFLDTFCHLQRPRSKTFTFISHPNICVGCEKWWRRRMTKKKETFRESYTWMTSPKQDFCTTTTHRWLKLNQWRVTQGNSLVTPVKKRACSEEAANLRRFTAVSCLVTTHIQPRQKKLK